MSTLELQNKAIELLKGEYSDKLLKQVIAFLTNNKSGKKEISPELQKALNDADESFKNGNYSSHDDVMKRMKTKFPELH